MIFMSNAKTVRGPKTTKIMLDKERNLRYDLNSFVDLEEEYGDINDALVAMQKGNIKALRAVLWAGLHHEDAELTTVTVGSMVDLPNLEALIKKLTWVLSDSLVEESTVVEGAHADPQ